MRTLFALLALSFLSACPAFADNGTTAPLTFFCSPENDLFNALKSQKYPRFDSALTAIEHAPTNSAVLILADGYPGKRTELSERELSLAQKKGLRLFIEFPGTLPGIRIGPVKTTEWERGVVASTHFGEALPALRILAIHDCHYVSIDAPNPLLVTARVAGFDSAIFGLPKNAAPLLFEIPESNLLVATTRLSGFVTARFAPSGDWKTIWEKILASLDPENAPHKMEWIPAVRPAFGADEKLPENFERKAFEASAGWIFQSGLLVQPSRQSEIHEALAANVEKISSPSAELPAGDGSLGILEGYASGILHDGNQNQRLPLRYDCITTSAVVLALDALLNENTRSARTSRNLLDYAYFKSGMCDGARSDPKHGAYGLVAWGAVSPAWLVANYGDDNANGILATIVASASLHDQRWDEPVMRVLLANLRTTGKLGFRGDRIDVPALEHHGWKYFHDAAPINYSPHFEAYLWACNLWAFRETGYRPFLDKTKNAIAMTMNVYPGGWRWKNNLERAHMLLCLAWLVRIEDTPEHREWLNRVADDLLKSQSASGAIYETLAGTGGGHYQVPQSNEAYGTTETPLIQNNGDPASDQLYTTGYALLGLHEAFGATGDKKFQDAENKLTEFLCRIQIRSKSIPYLDGWWFRAFHDRRWEFWASSADIGWGTWSLEAGWGPAWTAAVLGLREKKTTLWELTETSRVSEHFEKTRAAMELPK